MRCRCGIPRKCRLDFWQASCPVSADHWSKALPPNPMHVPTQVPTTILLQPSKPWMDYLQVFVWAAVRLGFARLLLFEVTCEVLFYHYHKTKLPFACIIT